MVVTDPSLEPGRAAGRLDAADQARRGERVQRLVDRLQGHVADAAAHPGGDPLDAEVVTARTVSSSATRTAVTRRPAPRSSSAAVGGVDAVTWPTYSP